MVNKLLTGSMPEAAKLAKALGLDTDHLQGIQFVLTVGEPAVVTAVYKIPMRVNHAEIFGQVIQNFNIKLEKTDDS